MPKVTSLCGDCGAQFTRGATSSRSRPVFLCTACRSLRRLGAKGRELPRCPLCGFAFSAGRGSDTNARRYCDVCRWLDRRYVHYDVGLVRGVRYESHGLTGRQYAALLALQQGRCGICSVGNQRLVIDHDHRCCSAGESCGACVRGLLCYGCNTAIGGPRSDPDVLRTAIAYLERGPRAPRRQSKRVDLTAAARQRRHRAHRRGDHSLCRPERACGKTRLLQTRLIVDEPVPG